MLFRTIKNAVNRFAPPDMPYARELAWHDGNGHRLHSFIDYKNPNDFEKQIALSEVA